nr:hypothetical protein [Streptomyces carpinensis]
MSARLVAYPAETPISARIRFRKQSADDIPGAGPPVVPGDHDVVQVQGLDEVAQVLAERACLPAAEPVGFPEPGGSETTQIRSVHPVTGLVQVRQHAAPAADVVRPAVHRHHRRPVFRAVGFVGDPQGRGFRVIPHARTGDPPQGRPNERFRRTASGRFRRTMTMSPSHGPPLGAAVGEAPAEAAGMP